MFCSLCSCLEKFRQASRACEVSAPDRAKARVARAAAATPIWEAAQFSALHDATLFHLQGKLRHHNTPLSPAARNDGHDAAAGWLSGSCKPRDCRELSSKKACFSDDGHDAPAHDGHDATSDDGPRGSNTSACGFLLQMWEFTNIGTLFQDPPNSIGSPYHRDPSKVPRISEIPM